MKLNAEQLSRKISADDLCFESTSELPEFKQILGQSRATKALEFGTEIQEPGYNIYIAGDTGSGRMHYVTEYLKPIAIHGAIPQDWLYVNNFDNPSEPHCIALAQGQGKALLNDIGVLIEEILATFPSLFENPNYIQERTALQNQFESQYDAAISTVEKEASTLNIAVFKEEGRISFLPLLDGKIAEDAYFQQMNDEERDLYHQNIFKLQGLLSDSIVELPRWQRRLNNQLREIHHHTIQQAIKPLIDEFQKNYHGNAGVLLYVAQMSHHLPKVIEEHFSETEKDLHESIVNRRNILIDYYLPNLLTRFNLGVGAPIVYESNPTYANLFGYIDYNASQGDIKPGCQHIIAGAFHRANNGYLILDIEKVLNETETWKAIKRALREKCISVEPSPSDRLLGAPLNIKPEPIPLSTKVILIGPRDIYYLLDQADSEFYQMFKVLVDFNSDFECSEENLNQFACLLHTRAKEAGIQELSAAAIARLAQYSCRLAEHQEKLSSRIDDIMDIMTEANHLRAKRDYTLIQACDIDTAVECREDRHQRLQDGMLANIVDGVINISTQGAICGQVNGLAIISNGDNSFGCPLRITATAQPGNQGIVDIEREVKLGLAIHTKGVLLLSGYLSHRYAGSFSLGFSSHIAIEQSYGKIDGDSASLAELCALISCLSDVSIKQGLAITGAVSQRGEAQAIGGVNEKIEGFFELCRARGLTGEQGVIIPAANCKNLMLSKAVIEAVEDNHFSIYTVSNVDEALNILTNYESGSEMDDGNFPQDSINFKVIERLKFFSKLSCKA